jgi:hypothetical protein
MNTTVRKGYLLAFLYCTTALGNSCPVALPPDPLSQKDTDCVEALEKELEGFHFPNIPLQGVRDELLRNHMDANQEYVINSFYVNYCELLSDQHLNLSAVDHQTQLDDAKIVLYENVPFQPPVSDSRNISAASEIFGDTLAWHDPNMFALASFEGHLSGEDREAKQVLKATTRSGLLREPPYVINKANRSFVIVGSFGSEKSVKEAVIKFKKKAPEYDFVAYEPYSNNSFYAVMIATWVPYSVALRVVKKAITDGIASDSYIWQCPPSEENVC